MCRLLLTLAIVSTCHLLLASCSDLGPAPGIVGKWQGIANKQLQLVAKETMQNATPLDADCKGKEIQKSFAHLNREMSLKRKSVIQVLKMTDLSTVSEEDMVKATESDCREFVGKLMEQLKQNIANSCTSPIPA